MSCLPWETQQLPKVYVPLTGSEYLLSLFEHRWSNSRFIPQRNSCNLNTLVLDYLNVEWFLKTQKELPFMPNVLVDTIMDYVDHNQRFRVQLMDELRYRVKVIYYRGRNQQNQAIICRNFHASSKNPRDSQPYPLLRCHVCVSKYHIIIRHHHQTNKQRPKDNPCRYNDHQWHQDRILTDWLEVNYPLFYRHEPNEWLELRAHQTYFPGHPV